jgi:tetratricopeptide (TPR) repeat protein
MLPQRSLPKSLFYCLPASSNNLQEWARRGQEFFSNGLYALAVSCFERAGQTKEVDIAGAYLRMSEAKQTQDKKAYVKAAETMANCAKRKDMDRSNNILWYHAAMCFEAAQDIPRASSSYRNGRFYDRAALVSLDSQNFDDCLLTLLSHSDDMDYSTFERVRDACRMYYLRGSNYE